MKQEWIDAKAELILALGVLGFELYTGDITNFISPRVHTYIHYQFGIAVRFKGVQVNIRDELSIYKPSESTNVKLGLNRITEKIKELEDVET